VLALLLTTALLTAEPPAPAKQVRVVQAPASDARLSLDLPLFDAPYNVLSGYAFPSTGQAVAITTGIYDLAHWAIARALDPWSDLAWKKALGITLISAFDALTFFVSGPASSAWTHEEFHLTALHVVGVKARNPLSTGFALPLLSPATVQVATEDVEALKQSNSAAFSLVNVAGLEAHAVLAQRFEHAVFFDDQPALGNFIIGFNHLLPSMYDLICLASAEGDCAWQVRHFFAPTESTATRPFTTEEERYLSMQFGLSLLNFVDPFLFTIRGVSLPLESGDEVVVNAALRAVPTPYGQEVRVDAYAKWKGVVGRVSLHNGFNHASWFPGLSAEAKTQWKWVRLSGGLALWLQPVNQSFTSAVYAPGGQLTLRLGAALLDGRLAPWLEGEAKSAGWVLGSPFLDARVSLRVGLTVAL
jgi:hypothetical protein